jgi:hypothetical protein
MFLHIFSNCGCFSVMYNTYYYNNIMNYNIGF